jgi:hypothetical protein
MIADFIDYRDVRWCAALDSMSHDVYHLPAYAHLSATEHKGGQARAFYASDGNHSCLIPLVTRPIPSALKAPSEWLDAISPYGYASPLLTHDGVWMSQAIQEFVRCCAENNIVSAFLRLHPFFDTGNGWSRQGDLVLHGQIVYVDLTASTDEIMSRMKAEHRTDIRKLLRLGFTTSVDEWALLDDFIQLYRDTMRRLGADQDYLFSRRYFDTLMRELGPAVHLISVLSPAGVLAAAGLYTSVGGIAQAHLAGNAAEFRPVAPSKLMQYAAIEWAKADGCRVLNLGGGLDCKADLLFRFKAAFSPLRRDFSTVRIVCDPGRYDALVAKSRSGQASPDGRDGFFPAYRVRR